MNEHDFEPVPGLPESLPDGETLIWQGSPRWQQMAIHVFHTQKIAAYFLILAAGLVAFRLYAGLPMADAIAAATGQIVIGSVVLGILVALSFAYSRSTIYTLTNRRLVLRFGVAIPMMINLPINKLDAVSVRMHKSGSGDVLLHPSDDVQLSWWALWPNTRPWRFAKAQPLLRCLTGAQAIGEEIALLLKQSDAVTQTRIAPARGEDISASQGATSSTHHGGQFAAA